MGRRVELMAMQQLLPGRDQFTEPQVGETASYVLYVYWRQKWCEPATSCLSAGFLPLTGL